MVDEELAVVPDLVVFLVVESDVVHPFQFGGDGGV